MVITVLKKMKIGKMKKKSNAEDTKVHEIRKQCIILSNVLNNKPYFHSIVLKNATDSNKICFPNNEKDTLKTQNKLCLLHVL